jgi:two-component system alkaline phosphatase synthesis response regulator PhoP
MSNEKILVVEDEEDIRELIAFSLEAKGYTAITAENGQTALELISKERPELVLLDIMLPVLDGFEVCKKLREQENTKTIPVIMVTARGEEGDIVRGLELGADDYLTKPFSPKILLARIQSVLRRVLTKSTGPKESVLIHGGLRMDLSRHTVHLENQELNLSATEYAILQHLVSNPGWVFTRNQIIDAVKGSDYPVTDRSVDVQILGIRKKLGDWSQNIETVRGVGYRMRSQD